MSIQTIVKTLFKHDNYYIITHKNPDGDTLGSAFALNIILQQMGKKSQIIIQPYVSNKILKDFPEMQENSNQFDYDDFGFYITVDVPSIVLLPDLFQECPQLIDLKIDHHLVLNKTLQNFGKIQLVKQYSSNSEIIYEILNEINSIIPLTQSSFKKIIKYLYLGISTDTGCFKYSNVNLNTFQVTSQLIKANPECLKINKTQFMNQSKSQLKLLKIILNTMKFHFNEQVITCYYDKSFNNDLTKGEIYNVNDILEYINQTENVKLCIMLKPKDNFIAFSMRSNDESINCGEICKNLNGGGHRGAAGGFVQEQDVNKSLEIILNEISKYI